MPLEVPSSAGLGENLSLDGVKVALSNPHFLTDLKFHGYVRDLVSSGLVKYIYFAPPKVRGVATFVKQALANRDGLLRELNKSGVEFLFSVEELNRKADVLLDFSLMTRRLDHSVPETLRKFSGLKIFHIGDYFWYHRATEKSLALSRAGVDYLFGYARHDEHCEYFRHAFPQYRRKVWGIPFGFSERFKMNTPLAQRAGKVVAVGSVVHLRPLDQEFANYIEPANYYPDASWMHPFRRELVLNRDRLCDVMVSALPIFPEQRDSKTNLVSAFNSHLGYVTCESIYNFPSAKTFEGMACGSVLFCADSPCNHELGLVHGENCVMFRERDIRSFEASARVYLQERKELDAIAMAGRRYVNSRFSHRAIAQLIGSIVQLAHSTGPSLDALSLQDLPGSRGFL
jgi:hypothetical protein